MGKGWDGEEGVRENGRDSGERVRDKWEGTRQRGRVRDRGELEGTSEKEEGTSEKGPGREGQETDGGGNERRGRSEGVRGKALRARTYRRRQEIRIHHHRSLARRIECLHERDLGLRRLEAAQP